MVERASIVLTCTICTHVVSSRIAFPSDQNLGVRIVCCIDWRYVEADARTCFTNNTR